MKIGFFLILVLPSIIASPPWEEWTQEDVCLSIGKTIFSFLDLLSEHRGSIDVEVPEHDTRSLLTSVIPGIVNGMLAKIKPIPIAKLGNETGDFYVKNAVITLNDPHFYMYSIGNSLNIENMSVVVPELVITADHYFIENLNLSIVQVSGEGALRLTLKDLRVDTKMDLKLRSGKFDVQSVYFIHLFLAEVESSLENLGGDGGALSELLNSILADVLPSLVQIISDEFNPGDDPQNFELLVPVFTIAFNTLYCAAKPNAELRQCLLENLPTTTTTTTTPAPTTTTTTTTTPAPTTTTTTTTTPAPTTTTTTTTTPAPTTTTTTTTTTATEPPMAV